MRDAEQHFARRRVSLWRNGFHLFHPQDCRLCLVLGPLARHQPKALGVPRHPSGAYATAHPSQPFPAVKVPPLDPSDHAPFRHPPGHGEHTPLRLTYSAARLTPEISVALNRQRLTLATVRGS